MREGFKRLRASLRWASAHPVLWIAIAMVLVWRAYSLYVPHVATAELDGEQLIVHGRSFGPRGSGRAVLYQSGGHSYSLEVLRWENEWIVARAREALATGSVRVERRVLYWPLRSAPVTVVVPAAGLPSQPFGYRVPVLPSSPWPLFRRDHRNTGYSPLPAEGGGAPWSFKTGKGIFSTPVIDGDGTIYVGSADRSFYAIDFAGREIWRYTTGGVIDSAAALLRPERPGEPALVVVPSGDGYVYCLRTGADHRNGRECGPSMPASLREQATIIGSKATWPSATTARSMPATPILITTPSSQTAS